ncbi:four-carbon acid sugar kinase family protein [Rhizobium leguminosarum]|uniref:four-carbon acid sugar kinase family protein n=1 Tax=Rhizobium leguminosarum TaxID=384 RepID=UPI001C93C3E9|nr:four-carbon acid sugar kinase family protein [Rhizobium leguminosarum]MBY5634333.1 four-carbon acid sugar kinase family protein [Rhizobium leguminosarum]MBY5724922.1 four-carbon acid sugar kinase family protein [Rhizobium leguminosarum]
MLAILADDLTGALDSAAPFAGRGLYTEVALHQEAIADIVKSAPDVLSINLDTREISPDEARAATAAVVALLPAGTRLFKKVDSRLKGNIAAELDAIPYSRAVVAPAIPQFDRFVEAGRVTGFGVATPIDIADRLGAHAGRASAPDTRSSADMEAVLQIAETDGTDLLVGARGLAETLACRMTAMAKAQAATIPAGRITFVIGSRDPITLAQVEHLRMNLALQYLPAPNGIFNGSPATDAELTLVQATPGSEGVSPKAVADALADGVLEYLVRNDGTLLLSGGATAEAVLRRLGLSRMRLHGECLPGLGLASANGRCIIAKSGGFGQPDTLKYIAEMVLRKAG